MDFGFVMAMFAFSIALFAQTEAGKVKHLEKRIK